jgi:hypothetical protein
LRIWKLKKEWNMKSTTIVVSQNPNSDNIPDLGNKIINTVNRVLKARKVLTEATVLKDLKGLVETMGHRKDPVDNRDLKMFPLHNVLCLS